MTRLKTEWIDHMTDGMDKYNSELAGKIGFDLAGLVRDTFGISKERYVNGFQDFCSRRDRCGRHL